MRKATPNLDKDLIGLIRIRARLMPLDLKVTIMQGTRKLEAQEDRENGIKTTLSSFVVVLGLLQRPGRSWKRC